MRVFRMTAWVLPLTGLACTPAPEAGTGGNVPQATVTIDTSHTHNRFSATIPPVARVASGTVLEVFTKEATDGQFTPASTAADVAKLAFDPIHPLTGPVYVEGAEPGDVLAVTLHQIEVGEWGWAAIAPGFGCMHMSKAVLGIE